MPLMDVFLNKILKLCISGLSYSLSLPFLKTKHFV